MKRLNIKTDEYTENARIDAFLEEVIQVSKKHGLSISHEDCHGGFEIEEYSYANEKWLMSASDATELS